MRTGGLLLCLQLVELLAFSRGALVYVVRPLVYVLCDGSGVGGKALRAEVGGGGDVLRRITSATKVRYGDASTAVSALVRYGCGVAQQALLHLGYYGLQLAARGTCLRWQFTAASGDNGGEVTTLGAYGSGVAPRSADVIWPSLWWQEREAEEMTGIRFGAKRDHREVFLSVYGVRWPLHRGAPTAGHYAYGGAGCIAGCISALYSCAEAAAEAAMATPAPATTESPVVTEVSATPSKTPLIRGLVHGLPSRYVP
jgi:hypothetical protein